MPLVSTGDFRIFFAHVPKTGGSSVEDYLIRRFGVRLSLIVVTPRYERQRQGLISPATHLSAEDLVDFLPVDLDYSFAVVRNPVDRMLSQYRFQQGASRTARMSFSTWVRVMIRCVQIDPRAYQNHLRPQTDLVPEDAEIFRMEDGFDRMVARLDAVTGTTRPGVEVGHLLKRPRTPIPMTRQDVQLIEEFYADDYARFGYERRDVSDLPEDSRAALRTAFAASFAPAVMWKQKRSWLR